MVLPTAKEMANKTKKMLEAKTESVLKKVESALERSTDYSATISLSGEEERSISGVIKMLQELGYEVQYTKGYFEDRPCGGHVSGTLKLNWSKAE